MRDFQQAIRLKTNDYRPDLTERIPIGSSVYPIETRNLVPDLEKIFMINERDSQVYMFEPQRTDMNIQDQDIVDDKSRVIYNDIWNGYSNPSRVRDQYLRCRPENPWAIPNIKKSISNQLQSFGQMLPAPVRSWFGIP
jgi:hypothetical protein